MLSVGSRFLLTYLTSVSIQRMSFFSELATVVASNLLSAMSYSSNDPLRVVEVSSGGYASRVICKRSQFLTLYGPAQGAVTYELVMNSPTSVRDKVYSLCRSDKDVADLHFDISKQILPLILQISPELCSLPRLQELWSLITSNPNWTAMHIAAYYGIQEALRNSTMLELVGYKEESTQMTPALLAAKQGKAEFIKAMTLLPRNISFRDLDAKGNSLYHYAAQSSQETVEAVSLCKIDNMINSLNNEGQTPLHLACAADKPECVRALISVGANPNCAGSSGLDSNIMSLASKSIACAREILTAFPNQLHEKDMKNGGTLLHWAKTKELVEALVELGCFIDSRNFNKETALHVMVQRDRFDCVLALLVCSADPNLVDSDGNSPLHLAAKSGELSTVQALVAFGADPNLLNQKGETARHIAQRRSKHARSAVYVIHSVGGKRCAQNSPKCSDSCSPSGKDDGKAPEVELIPRSRHLFDDTLDAFCFNSANQNMARGDRILCLDGGGIRGLVLTQLLHALEGYLDGPIVQHFDWMAGTSTGGILGLCLASGKSVKYCKSLYFKLKDKVFIGKKPYDEKILEQFLREEFGERSMADLSGPKIIVTAVAADTIPSDLHLFRNYTPPQDLLHLPEKSKQKKPEEQLIWQAARASGAAPTYFRAFGSYLDGGLMSNNPTVDVLTEIQEYNAVLSALGSGHKVSKPSMVVSLGTGAKPTEEVITLDLFRPESFLDTARLAFGVSTLGKLLVEQATCTDRRVVDRARAWCSMAGAAYFRLSPSFTLDVALDCTDDLVLVQMLWETQAYIHSHQGEFKKIAQLLKSELLCKAN